MNDNTRELLVKTASVVRQLRRERDWLINELATTKHAENISKFAQDLVKKGIFTEDELEEKCADLQKVGNLKAIKEAAAILQPGKASDPPSIGSVEKTAGMEHLSKSERRLVDDPAVRYLLGCIGMDAPIS